jgi:hypothetical protein
MIWLSCFLMIGGCISCTRQKKLNKYVSLWRKDKIPYGTYYAFENLSSIFPDARIRTNAVSPRALYYDTREEDDTAFEPETYVILSPSVMADKGEVKAMINFAGSGNQLFISAIRIGKEFLDALHLKMSDSLSGGSNDSLRLSLYKPGGHDRVNYFYPGYCLDAYFTSLDTPHTQVLGRNYMGKPDFIRIAFQHGGSIYIQLAPLAFSNFFLLYGKNRTYYDYALSYLPKTTRELLWDDYFRYRKPEKFSALHFILGNRAFRWAFWLTILLFLLLYIFESKRKQRAIRQIPPAANASVDFVKTIGRLYLQQKNNQNLALKMIAAFLDQVRSVYHIPTAELNNEFSEKLALRSGRSVGEIRDLTNLIHETRMQGELSDAELMNLHRQFELFNKPNT